MKKVKTQNTNGCPNIQSINYQQIYTQQVIYKHPNLLFNILDKIVNLQPSTFLTQAQKIRIIALIGFCHPVMNKEIQSALERMINKKNYWSVDRDMILLMEILNIVCLIPGINYSILNIKQLPTYEVNSYEEALWANSLPYLSHNNHFQQAFLMIQSINKQNTLKVREFINNLYTLKQKVKTAIYQNEQQHIYPQNHYHQIDIVLAQKGIVTVDYFPEDFITEYIEIWLDRTVELNSLLGNYVCKQKFGEFQYIKGPLMYAMHKGILLVFNNFNQISNQLLVNIKSLSIQGQITHNQKKIRANAGFKILGIISGEKNNKSKINISKLVDHFKLPRKNPLQIIPLFQNQQNRLYLLNILKTYQKQLGYLGLKKLWKRIVRLRKRIIHTQQNESQEQINSRLWNTFFTQQFLDQIVLQINDLTNKSDKFRVINCQQKYRMIDIGRTQITFNTQPLLKIVKTQYSLAILEKLIICFELGQYPLLISQTGCGKTTLVQYLAELSGHKLYVYNMSSGTDVTDLIGGFKPIDCRVLLKELFYTFLQKFRNDVPGAQKNENYLSNLTNYYVQGKVQILLKSLIQSIPKIIHQLQNTSVNLTEWKDLMKKFNNIFNNLDKIDSNLVFSFLEGNLIKAIKNGDWILIDEINLATNDVLQKIVPLIEDKSLMLYEKGDLNYIERHPDFRIVACMNPANDSGKKPLPLNLAQKFTTINMSDPSKADIEMMSKQICSQLNEAQISQLFFKIKKIKTVSLRNLSRALHYINKNRDTYGWNRSVYDGLMLGFGQKELLKQFYNQTIPKLVPGTVEISGFLLTQGPYIQKVGQIFHLTQTFKHHLKDFLRAIAGTELPVLLQGPTSAGKTSMIRYVAQTVGYKCYRINNHEHTQIQQYIGNYFPDKTGKLVFREGPLVQAVRQGYWLILDELNLAKTQILECLNRLLDDNRQLFIPQQQKHIKPHPNFRIFATQNPSTYSGRKTLSRAFRNRFVGISFMDITTQDTMAILQARTSLLKDSKQLSVFVKKTLESLTNYRQRQRVFEKDGLITIRNLLKWCERPFINKEKFIMEGYAILAEKLRNQQQKKFVQKVLLSAIKYNLNHIKEQYDSVVGKQFSQERISQTKIYVQMNESFRRMSALTIKAISNNQPVLLIGQTGCGKTTLAELLSELTHRKFFSINCHKHMEASDLLGSLRPSLNPSSNSKFQFVNGVVIDAMIQGGILLIDEINTAEDSVLERLNQVLQSGLIGIERGDGWEIVKAKEGFCIIATMNPSGDYGKKQLSPALRNRFTQIWVEPITHPEYILNAKADILKMINHKLLFSQQIKEQLSVKIYEFLAEYNCIIAPRYNLTRKLLTMRDIGWICKFINQCGEFDSWTEKYFWSITILAIEGIKYIMTDNIEGSKLQNMKQQLLKYLATQIDVKPEWIKQTQPENIISLIKNMNFPLLIKTDMPIEVLGIQPKQQIFFSPQTDLSDLLGQFRPQGSDFIWLDQPLLKCIKQGGIVALIDLNMAQQQVIEGINSLFDHRGSLFVVELNKTFHKAQNFKPIVVLRNQTGNGRKGLPNSFLNRFVKLSILSINLEIKLKYLFQKYQFLSKQQPLLRLVTKLLQEQQLLPIESIQFIIQFAHHGLLRQSLQILHLQKYQKEIIVDSKFSKYESEILQLLPFKKSLSINTPSLIKLIIYAYLIYRYSTFNLCIVGNSYVRYNIAQTLAYLLENNLVKILISTMIDLNDLLGTYEQVSANSFIQVETNLSNSVTVQVESDDFQSEQTKFIFIQSRIVKSMRDECNLVYVEVPNDTISERIEKGLKDVYHQRRKIVLGLDNNPKKNDLSKFITLDAHETVINTLLQERVFEAFPQNQSNLHAKDRQIRKQQMNVFINDSLNEQSDRKSLVAWRRLLAKFNNQSHEQQEKNKAEISEKLKREMMQKYKVSIIDNSETQQRTKAILNKIWTSGNKEVFINKVTLQSFFTSDVAELNKKLTYLNDQQEYLIKIIRKFQVLYSCDVNNFKHTAKTIMPVLFKTSSNGQLIKKYFSQIERLYEQLFKFKIKQTLIQYTEQQHKLVPILNNVESIRYLMSIQGADVRRICDSGPHLDHILEGIEKVVIANVKLIEIDIQSIGLWCKDVSVKKIGVLQILQDNLAKRNKMFDNILKDREIQAFLKEINKCNGTDKLNRQYVLELFDTFKPNNNMSINIGYHLKNELNLRYLTELISDDEQFVKKYSKLCEVKYFNYLPQEFKTLRNNIEGHKKQIVRMQKLLIYRGYNNIENLIQFYEKLMFYTKQIQNNNFSNQIIRKVIIQSFHTYYHIYNDVLIPFYIPLIAIYADNQDNISNNSLVANIISSNREDVVELIENLIRKEEGEVDRSKDYLRFQKKFNRTVIIDQYTEEGVEKNKQNLEQQFSELFGKHSLHDKVKIQSPFQKIHMLINKTKQNYYPYLSKTIFMKSTIYQQMINGIQIMLKDQQKDINIYEQYNPSIISALVHPIPSIMEEIHELVNKYQIDNIKNLANICFKIQERSIYQQIYKVLIDCQFLVQKIYQVNAILPLASHIQVNKLVENCLTVRKLELKNWKQMLELKIRRTQKSDMIQFVQLYKNIKEIQNQKQLFALCQRYLRESKLSCINNRINLLIFLQKQGVIPRVQSYRNSLHRVIGFFQYLMPDINRQKQTARKAKEQEMKEYQKLAGWNSNEYLIFKATCEKFQRKIHHILKRYDQQLSMAVGDYHQKILNDQIFNSIKQFKSGLLDLLGNKQEPSDELESNEEIKSQENDKNESEDKEIIQEEGQLNDYERLNKKIFISLKQLQEEHHNTQSKLLIIRTYVSEAEDLFSQFTLTSKVQNKYLSRDMFLCEEDYKRGVKYYYGLWDKLCQRAQTKWNREIIDRLWHVIEKIWVHINLSLKFSQIKSKDQLAQDLKVVFNDFINKDTKYHPLFIDQINKVKEYLQKVNEEQQVRPNEQIIIPNELISLMKLGYILANINVNLQKNGLCVKQDEEENQNSGSEDIGDGMGIGEGEAHDAAENVGDQIEFQQQVMGHKDQQKNQDKNAGNKEENDIEMDADFEGEMYSKEQENEQESGQEGKQKEADEKMGDVDQKQKEQDMKNEAGQAEGSEQADVDIKNQKQGDQQLIDNERQNKEQRKGEDKRQMQEEQGEQQKSDWDSNNQEGQKINKQKEDVQAQQQSQSFDMDKDKKPQQMEQQQGENSQMENQQEQGQDNQDQQHSKNDQENQEVNSQEMDLQNNEDDNQDGEQDQQNQEQAKKQRKGRQTKRYDPAYGRRDMNTNNQVLNNQEEPAKQADNQGNQQQGQGQGDQGSGNPIHNLSAQFLQEILRQQRSQGNQQFIKDLNVMVHDENEPEANKEQEGAEQFQLTHQKDKFATNLPLMDDHKMENQDQQKQQENNKDDDKRKDEEKKQKNKQLNEKQKQERLQKDNKKGKQTNKNDSNEKNKDNSAGQQKKRQFNQDKKTKQQSKIQQLQIIQQDQQKDKLVRKAIQLMKNQQKQVKKQERENQKDILSESFEVSKILQEQLKSVLQPMDNAEYRGDFKTGKKLNLKKIIPFIASNYRKDKIWLRRTEPSQRNYYVMIALDDTKSMHYGNVGQEALKGLLAISMALEHLSIKTSICSIRDEMVNLKKFGDLLNSQSILNNFQFCYQSSNSHDLSMAAFMSSSLQSFKKIEEEDDNIEVKKLCFIISDGKMNKKLVQPFMKDVKKQDITYVFIIVDSQQSSILNIKTVEYGQNRKMKVKNYMSDFPFEYFLIINDVKQLGQILALTLMQFIQQK